MPTQVQRTAAARRRLISATRELVAAQGVGNTSVAAIGERAGMSRGAVNFHFGSKDDLLVEVTKEVVTDWEEQVFGSARGALDDIDRLVDTLLATWLGEMHTDPERVRIVIVLLFEALGPSPHLHQHFVALGVRVRDRVAAYLRARQDAGTVSASIDPVALATVFLGLLAGVPVAFLLEPSESDLDALIAEARETFLARLRP